MPQSFLSKLKTIVLQPLANTFESQNKVSLLDQNKSKQLYSKDAFYGSLKVAFMLIFLVSQFLPVIDGINSTQTKIAQTLIPLPKKVPIKKTDIEIMVVFGRINFQSGVYDFMRMPSGRGLDYDDFLLIQDQKEDEFDDPNAQIRMEKNTCSQTILQKFAEQNYDNLYPDYDSPEAFQKDTLQFKAQCYNYKDQTLNNDFTEIIQFKLPPSVNKDFDLTCENHDWELFDENDFNQKGIGQGADQYACDPSDFDRTDGKICCGDGKILYNPAGVTKTSLNPNTIFTSLISAENTGSAYAGDASNTSYKKGIAIFVAFLQQSLSKSGIQQDIETVIVPLSTQNSINVDLKWRKNEAVIQEFPLFPFDTEKKQLFSWDQRQKTYFGNTEFLVQIQIGIEKNALKTVLTVPNVVSVISPLGGFVTGIMVLLSFFRNNFSGYDKKKQIEQHYGLLKKSKVNLNEFEAKKLMIQTPQSDIYAQKKRLFYEEDFEKKLQENDLKLKEAIENQKRYEKESDLIDKFLDQKLSQAGQQKIKDFYDMDYFVDHLRLIRVALLTIFGDRLYNMIGNYKESIIIDDVDFRKQVEEKKIDVKKLSNLKFIDHEVPNQAEIQVKKKHIQQDPIKESDIELVPIKESDIQQVQQEEKEETQDYKPQKSFFGFFGNDELEQDNQENIKSDNQIGDIKQQKPFQIQEIGDDFGQKLHTYFLKNFQKQMDENLKPIKLEIS